MARQECHAVRVERCAGGHAGRIGQRRRRLAKSARTAAPSRQSSDADTAGARAMLQPQPLSDLLGLTALSTCLLVSGVVLLWSFFVVLWSLLVLPSLELLEHDIGWVPLGSGAPAVPQV